MSRYISASGVIATPLELKMTNHLENHCLPHPIYFLFLVSIDIPPPKKKKYDNYILFLVYFLLMTSYIIYLLYHQILSTHKYICISLDVNYFHSKIVFLISIVRKRINLSYHIWQFSFQKIIVTWTSRMGNGYNIKLCYFWDQALLLNILLSNIS